MNEYNKYTQPGEHDIIRWSVSGDAENMQDSVVEVNHARLFKEKYPTFGGPYDSHMGTTDHRWRCSACKNKKTVCDGHFGHTQLNYPVKSPLYLKEILKWLKIVCMKCGSLLVTKNIKITGTKRINKYIIMSKSERKCKNCDHVNPLVFKNKLEPNMFQYDVLTDKGVKKVELLNSEISKILNRVSDKCVLKVGKPLSSHPKKFIISTLRIPPNTIRPDIRSLGGNRSNNDDITAFIKNIIEQNLKIQPLASEEELTDKIRNKYYSLDAMVSAMMKGNSGSNSQQVRVITSSHKQPTPITGRFPKKTGRPRYNLMGKRVWNMVRSVITGDCYMKINELGMPKSVAMNLTIPIIVQDDNIDLLNIYFNNKREYPGISGIMDGNSKKFYNVDYLQDDYKLKIGDKVYRHLIDGGRGKL